MILEYHRPKTVKEALQLLNRSTPLTRPLAGGTVLNQPGQEAMAVVDLQSLGLDASGTAGEICCGWVRWSGCRPCWKPLRQWMD